ncbi:MAG: electron transfer flavoprotein subunit beta/FixA family protein [Candidatus Lokiarchaeota archaeon]|nr:electron transfer flavoprotein subunit beta/FixA family protein [Candidatus Lokiarchaeota archaeon]
MRFIVCVKQVPDTTEVKIDPETNTLKREGVPSILNPFDQFALEEAIKIKQEDDEIIVISMGPPQAKRALLKCLALGADKAILLTDKAFAGADTWATSYTLTQCIKKIGDFDAIFCGLQAIDGDTAQVGPEIAAQLGIPQITYVESIEKVEGKKMTAKVQTDDGYKIVEARLPVLITGITPSSFEPTNPPMMSIIKANKKPFSTWTIDDLGGNSNNYGLNGSLTEVIKVYSPPVRQQGIIIEEEEPEAAVKKLVELLSKDKVIYF